MELSSELLRFSLIAAVWSLPWKGLALWKAARENHTAWFIIILVINTLGLLEIFYLFIVPPRVTIKFSWKKERK